MKQLIFYIVFSFALSLSSLAQHSFTDSLLAAAKNADKPVTKISLLLQLANRYNTLKLDSQAIHSYQQALTIARQIRNDSLKAFVLKQTGVYYFSHNNPEIAQNYFTQALRLYKKLNDTTKICTIYNNLAIIYKLKGNYNLASSYIDKSLELNHEKFPESMSDSYNIKGTIYLYRNDYKQAMLSYQKSLDIAQKHHLQNNIADNYNNLGQVQYLLGNHSLAAEYYTKALNLNKTLGNIHAMANNLNNLGNIYLNDNEFKKAKQYYTQALELNRSINNQISLANNYMNIGIVYYYEGRYAQTIRYFKKTLAINRKLGNKKAISTVLYNLAELNLNLADSVSFSRRQRLRYLNEALDDITEAIRITKAIHLPDAEQANYELLSSIYEKLGKPLQALHYFKLHSTIKDSLFNQEKSKQLAELETRYQVKQKTKDIQNLLKQQQLQANLLKIKQQQSKKQRIALIVISSSLVLLLIFFLLILRLLAQKKKANHILAEQNEEILLQRDELETRKKEIENIHHNVEQSIDYAKRIQTSILTSPKILKKHIADFFVLFYPRDKVSGDFYWWEHVDNHTIVTVSDCTGHGVPGAFMSILGISFLREIVTKEYITHPGVILRRLRKEIVKTLKQANEIGTQKDGMDMALISIDHTTGKLQYAGANNPLYIVSNRKLQFSSTTPVKSYQSNRSNKTLYEIKPDKMPIGIYQKMERFSTHEIQLQKGDQIYLFSDGFADQFGGPNGKKFKIPYFRKLILDTAHLPAAKQQCVVAHTLKQWQNGYEQIDDITLIALFL